MLAKKILLRSDKITHQYKYKFLWFYSKIITIKSNTFISLKKTLKIYYYLWKLYYYLVYQKHTLFLVQL